jgi:hypothetical protein
LEGYHAKLAVLERAAAASALKPITLAEWELKVFL